MGIVVGRSTAVKVQPGPRSRDLPDHHNALSGGQDAELVVIGIGHDHPTDLTLADIDSICPEDNETVDLRLLTVELCWSDVEMHTVFPVLRDWRRATPGDERTGSVRCAYSGLIVLIPNQRPSEGSAPELPDVPSPVAVDRSETFCSCEETVPGLEDAQLVALWVGEHHMAILGVLTNVDVAGAELKQRLDRFLLITHGRRRQVKMDTVLASLLFGNLLEQDSESGVVRRHECDLAIGFDVDLPSQSGGPKLSESKRIVGVEAERDEPARGSFPIYHD